MRDKLEREVKRFNKFQQSVLGLESKDSPEVKEVDMKNYAKYILKEGSITEQRELLTFIKNRLVMINKRVVLEK